MTPVLPFFAVGFCAVMTIALAQAMASHPDPSDMVQRPLNGVLIGGLGWSALVMTAVNSVVHFGLVIPALGAAGLFATYRIWSGTNLIPFYRYGLAIGILTVVFTILVASQHFTVRSIS